MTHIILRKERDYEAVLDLEDVEILAKVSNKDIEKIRELKFEKMKEELMKTINVTIDDIKEAIEKGIVKPAETEDEWKQNLAEKGYGKYIDKILPYIRRKTKIKRR